MYVCICNAIREADLRKAGPVCEGDAETVYEFLGFQPQCRQCLDEAEHILAQARQMQSLPGVMHL